LRKLAAGRSEGEAGCFSAARTLAVCRGGRVGLLLLVFPLLPPAASSGEPTLDKYVGAAAAAASVADGAEGMRGLPAGLLLGSGLGVLHLLHAACKPKPCCGCMPCCAAYCCAKLSACAPQAPLRMPPPVPLHGDGAVNPGCCCCCCCCCCCVFGCGGHEGGDICVSIGQSAGSGSCRCCVLPPNCPASQSCDLGLALACCCCCSGPAESKAPPSCCCWA
jgi:hypothetical protein